MALQSRISRKSIPCREVTGENLPELQISIANCGEIMTLSSHLEQNVPDWRSIWKKGNMTRGRAPELAKLCKADRTCRTIGAARGKAARGAPLRGERRLRSIEFG